MKISKTQLVVLAATLAMVSTSAMAGTTGTEFQALYNLMLGWAQGFLGKTIAISAFILGLGMGIAKSSPIPALTGVVFAMFVVYIPNVISGVVTGIL